MSVLPSLRDPPAHPDTADTASAASAEGGARTWQPLPRGFYERHALELAVSLLGCLLLTDGPQGVSGGVIVETEAYGGPEDRASHARAGLTRRTAPMFGPAGHAYVYLVYGMHSCMNVVAESAGMAGAVLLRAVEPRFDVELMRSRRGAVAATAPNARLAAGPARLCQALGFTRRLDGHDLSTGHALWLAAAPDGEGSRDVVAGPRIGVAYAREWADRPWRFGVAGSPSLSRPFPGERS